MKAVPAVRVAVVLGLASASIAAPRLDRSLPWNVPFVSVLVVATLAYGTLALALMTVLRRSGDRVATSLLAVACILAVAGFVVGYRHFGPGWADTDDALDILADSLVHGFNPYLHRTFLGHRLSPMMGAGLLALPFRVVLGSAAYQNPSGLWWGPLCLAGTSARALR